MPCPHLCSAPSISHLGCAEPSPVRFLPLPQEFMAGILVLVSLSSAGSPALRLGWKLRRSLPFIPILGPAGTKEWATPFSPWPWGGRSQLEHTPLDSLSSSEISVLTSNTKQETQGTWAVSGCHLLAGHLSQPVSPSMRCSGCPRRLRTPTVILSTKVSRSQYHLILSITL